MQEIKNQIANLVNKSNNILIAPPENINGDALGSSLALVSALKKLRKNSQLILPKFLPSKFNFLNDQNSLSQKKLQEREFILSIKDPKNQIKKLYYQKSNGLLHLYLGGEKKIEERDIQIRPSRIFDLIFTINTQEFSHLGKIFEQNPELFFDTPIINIDNHPNNQNIGQINLIDINSSSVSEIIMDLIDFIDRKLLDSKVATKILAGIIDTTDNFQAPKTTPRTFNNAALLINRGGDQQKIIRYFYKSKSLNFLRLWGRILHKLCWSKSKKIAWAKLTQKDFQKTNTNSEALSPVFEEIKKIFPEIRASFILWPTLSNDKIKFMLKTNNPQILNNFAIRLNGVLKNNILYFEILNKSPEETEKEVLNLIKQQL